jgi:hypothetical protein
LTRRGHGGNTGGSTWTIGAQYAQTFIVSMWNSQNPPGFFRTGTNTDGVSTNTDCIPEDCPSWSYLALEDPQYAASIDWAYTTHAALDGVLSGVSFSNADTSGVWFEGTGHMAAALAARKAAGDSAKAAAFPADIQLGQAQAPNANGLGIDAASKDGLAASDGDYYYASLHVGATAWYCLAAQASNPFLL